MAAIKQMKNLHATSLSHLLGLLCLTAHSVRAQWVGNLKHVLGDTKQAQIHDKISSSNQINNLLDGFEEMGFSGVRINIFTSDEKTPNLAMFDELHSAATNRGFDVFANPAEWAGGQRIANGDAADFDDRGPSPLNNDEATQALINRVLEFAQKYKCKWINPFNEDGPADREWSTDQINTIYSSLDGNLNGADLIGPGAWGIADSLSVLTKTNVGNIVKIATTHNLGFNHDRWDDFIDAAAEFGLEVWDSEVNHNEKFPGVPTRLEAALTAGVDGLVVYNSWKWVSLSDGSISNAGQTVRSLILIDDGDDEDDGDDDEEDDDTDDEDDDNDDDDDNDGPEPSEPQPSPSSPDSSPTGSGSSPSD